MTSVARTTLWLALRLAAATMATPLAAAASASASATAAVADTTAGGDTSRTTVSVAAMVDTVIFRDPQAPFDAARFDTLTATALRVLLEEAAVKGLPTTPLINRALEGAARRVGGARILFVVKAHAAALADAKLSLGDGSTVAELDAGADAIRAGIDPKTLSLVRSTRPAGSAVTALVVLTDVVNRGVSVSTARDAVAAIARMPRSDDALLGLQSTVAKNAQRGPGMALEALNRYVRSTVVSVASPSTPPVGDHKPVRPPLL